MQHQQKGTKEKNVPIQLAQAQIDEKEIVAFVQKHNFGESLQEEAESINLN